MKIGRELDKQEVESLERLLDATDIREIISKLSWICSEKSTHVAENWQDIALAKEWMHCSILLDRCHVQLEELVD